MHLLFDNIEQDVIEKENINFPWLKKGKIIIAEVLSLSLEDQRQRFLLKKLLKCQSNSLINLSVFPLTEGECKYIFNDIDDLLNFYHLNEEFQVIPTIIFNNNVFLILEQDIQMLFLIYSDIDETFLEEIENIYTPNEYKEKIQYLIKKGFI
jgi:hypothetical protein